MTQRMSRTHKRRSSFKIDSLLAEKLKSAKATRSCLGNFMTIMFQGFFDRAQTPPANALLPATNNNDHLEVSTLPMAAHKTAHLEVLLMKVSQKKRKESSSTVFKQIGVVEIPLNPTEDLWDVASAKFATVSLNTDLLDPADGPVTQIVVFRMQNSKDHLYSSELMIYDKMGRCLLSEGEYQLSLQEASVPPAGTNKNGCSPKKYSSWENLSVFHSDSSGFEDQFEKNPLIKFQLHWTEQPYSGDCERIVQVKAEEPEVKAEIMGAAGTELIAASKKSLTIAGHEIFGVPTADLQIAFHFVHNNVSHQTTQNTSSMDCPWCNLNCLSLYSLLKHLKLCHARFAFNFVQSGTAARIEVSINELFDGSYAGPPHNLLTSPAAGYAFSRSGPVRRTSVTHVLVCRPRRPKPSLAEFVETDEALEMSGAAGGGPGHHDRPFLTGHNRLYHHTMTCLPVHPKELDEDSEGECDPPWLKQKTMMMIDEFTDVNEGEKELMKMWNLHVMRHGFVGDCQTALACDMFVELHGRELLAKNLYRNFVVHMCSLFDYGLIPSEPFHKAVQKLQRRLNESADAKQVIYDARAQHLQHWNTVGHAKYQQQLREKEQAEKTETASAAATTAAAANKAKRKETAGESGSTTVTRSRELFQKPSRVSSDAKGGGGGGDAIENKANSNRKKTGGVAGLRAPQPTQPTTVSLEHPMKRKLERGEQSTPLTRRTVVKQSKQSSLF